MSPQQNHALETKSHSIRVGLEASVVSSFAQLLDLCLELPSAHAEGVQLAPIGLFALCDQVASFLLQLVRPRLRYAQRNI